MSERLFRLSAVEVEATGAQVRNSLGRLAVALEVTPSAMMVVDEGGRLIMANQPAEDLLGYRQQELLSQSLTTLASCQHQHEFTFLSVRSSEIYSETIREVLIFLHKNGTEVPVDLHARWFNSEQGHVALCVLHPSSNLRLSTVALRQMEERLQVVMDHMTEGLVLAGFDGQLLHWNPAACRLHGISNAQQWSRQLSDFTQLFELSTLEGRILAFDEWPMRRVLAGEVVSDCRVVVRRLDTEWRRVFTYNGGVVREASGQPIAFLTIADHTQRYNAELTLRRSVGFTSAVLDSISTHVAVVGESGRITALNKAWQDFAARHPSIPDEPVLGRAKGESCFKEVPCEYTTHPLCRGLREVLDGVRASYQTEYNLRLNDKTHWFLVAITPFPQGGRSAVVSFIDVTEQKRTEFALRDREEEFRALVTATAQVVWRAEADGRFLQDCPAWREFTGQSYREWHGLGWMNAVHPDDRKRLRPIRQKALEAGESFNLDLRFRHHSGTWHWFQARGVPLLDVNGTVRSWIGMSTDITAQRTAQETISRQAALLDQAREAIIVSNTEGQVLFWSKGAERMYGWMREEAMGKNVVELLYDYESSFTKAKNQVLQSGEWIGELEQRTKKGENIAVEAHWSLLRGDTGNPDAIFGINLDITSRKQLEAQYLRAQRMESIGTLAGGIAHDLNNMLAPIMMSLELLRGKLPLPRDQQLLELLEDGARRGADMVRHILTFSRGAETRECIVHPKELVDDVRRILKDSLLRQVQLQTTVMEDVWFVSGDPTQLHQVLLNLCVNARDAMPDGGTLTVSAENVRFDEHYAAMHLEAKPGDYVLISVVDTGSGIPQAIRDKIFDPFFTTKEVGKGTGLGLATTAAIVRNHQGFVNVYSEVGRGSTFNVYLPAEKDATAQSKPQPEPSLPRGRGESILVVDDDCAILTITEQTLAAFGYQVFTAANGAEAIAVFAQHMHIIQVVLTDLTMPVMDGIATTHALRKLKPELPIIAASGFGTEAQHHAAARAGAEYFLEKPYTADAILNILYSILHQQDGPATNLRGMQQHEM